MRLPARIVEVLRLQRSWLGKRASTHHPANLLLRAGVHHLVQHNIQELIEPTQHAGDASVPVQLNCSARQRNTLREAGWAAKRQTQADCEEGNQQAQPAASSRLLPAAARWQELV